MHSRNIKYIPEVDQLRALAALLVMIYHGLHLFRARFLGLDGLDLQHWIETANPLLLFIVEGHTGVAMFIVLSGFIFTSGMLGRRLNYAAFIYNRVLRIYPLLLALILLGWVFYSDQFTLQRLVRTLFGLANYPGALNLGEFTKMFWSIALECQFYLVFPVFLLLANRYGWRPLAGFIVLIVVARYFYYQDYALIRDKFYFTMIGRLDQFLVGMLLGYIYQHYQPKPMHHGRRFLLALIVMYLTLLLLNQQGGWPTESRFKLLWPLLEASAWAFFVFTYLHYAKRFKGLCSRILTQIGVISYSIYLLHMIAVDNLLRRGWLMELTGSPLFDALLNAGLLLVPLVLAVSFFSYRWVEKPFLDLRKKYYRRRSGSQAV